MFCVITLPVTANVKVLCEISVSHSSIGEDSVFMWATILRLVSVTACLKDRIIVVVVVVVVIATIKLSPGGSGYFTCIQNMKLVTTK